MKIISRKEAKVKNLKHYFTGKPCKRGHVTKRRTSSGSCLECDEVYRERHRDSHLIASKNWRDKNKEYDSLYHKEHYQQNKEHKKKLSKLWKQNNAEHYSEQQKEYYQQTKPERSQYHKQRWLKVRKKELKRLKQQREENKLQLQEEFQRLASNTPYSIDNEHVYKWFCAGQLMKHFELEILEEYYITPRSRIDLYLPLLKLGIEVKLDGVWNLTQVYEQQDRYKRELGKDHQVVVVSPKGSFQLNHDQLITFVQDLLSQ